MTLEDNVDSRKRNAGAGQGDEEKHSGEEGRDAADLQQRVERAKEAARSIASKQGS